MENHLKRIVLLILITLITSCGGGKGNSPTAITVTTSSSLLSSTSSSVSTSVASSDSSNSSSSSSNQNSSVNVVQYIEVQDEATISANIQLDAESDEFGSKIILSKNALGFTLHHSNNVRCILDVSLCSDHHEIIVKSQEFDFVAMPNNKPNYLWFTGSRKSDLQLLNADKALIKKIFIFKNELWIQSNANSFQKSKDGVNWITTASLGVNAGEHSSLLIFENHLIFISGRKIWYSVDGYDWQLQSEETPFESTSNLFPQITKYESPVAQYWMVADAIWTTSNGIDWRQLQITPKYKGMGVIGRTLYGLDDAMGLWKSEDGNEWILVRNFGFQDTSPYGTHTWKLVSRDNQIWFSGIKNCIALTHLRFECTYLRPFTSINGTDWIFDMSFDSQPDEGYTNFNNTFWRMEQIYNDSDKYYTNTRKLQRSTDNKNWSYVLVNGQTLDATLTPHISDGTFLATDSFISTNGFNWKQSDSLLVAGNYGTQATYKDKFYRVTTPWYDHHLASSEDRINWQNIESPLFHQRLVSYAGKMWSIVINTNDDKKELYNTTDFANWSKVSVLDMISPLEHTKYVELETYDIFVFENQLLLKDSSNRLWKSADGIQWKRKSSTSFPIAP